MMSVVRRVGGTITRPQDPTDSNGTILDNSIDKNMASCILDSAPYSLLRISDQSNSFYTFGGGTEIEQVYNTAVCHIPFRNRYVFRHTSRYTEDTPYTYIMDSHARICTHYARPKRTGFQSSERSSKRILPLSFLVCLEGFFNSMYPTFLVFFIRTL